MCAHWDHPRGMYVEDTLQLLVPRLSALLKMGFPHHCVAQASWLTASRDYPATIIASHHYTGVTDTTRLHPVSWLSGLRNDDKQGSSARETSSRYLWTTSAAPFLYLKESTLFMNILPACISVCPRVTE